MTISIPINQVSHNLTEWIRRVMTDGEAVLLTAEERPQAVLISLDDWRALQAMRAHRAARLAALEQAQAFSAQVRAARPADDVDATTLLHTLRETRDAELQGLR